MQTVNFSGLAISRLTLGTVQFGMDYGIANKGGRLSYRDVHTIIAQAYEGGVNTFDTAAGYGESEKIIGRIFQDLNIADKVVIITKVCHLEKRTLSDHAADELWKRSVVDSLNNLQLDVLPVCLIHTEEDFSHISSLMRLKDQGLVGRVGISVMTPAAGREILSSGLVEAMQIPSNILDRRFINSEIISQAKDKGLALFVRSVYLQGLLLMPEADMPAELAAVAPVRRNLKELANRAGMDVAEMALRYILAIEGVTSILTGVDSPEQMRQNLELFEKGPLSPDLVTAITGMVPDLPDNILMPTRWSRPASPR